MREIKISVQNKTATAEKDRFIVCGNGDYTIKFEFDSEWSGYNFKTALFVFNGKLVPVPFDGNVCKVPILRNTTLCAVGVKSSDEEVATTTPAFIPCKRSAEDLTDEEIPAPTQDVYDEIIALLNKNISGGGSVDLSDYQKKVDENLPTTNKTIVGAIAEVKEIAETAKMVFGETEGTAYEGNKGKANADNIAKLQNEMAVVNVALEQSGLVKKYKQPITQEYNERVTANGLNVLDGSKAVLKKVVGSTVRYDADENGLNGKLANASFGGIESTNADGTETATLVFPKTETPLGTTIDFENKKITDYGVTIEFKGTAEDGISYYQYGANENRRNGIRLRLAKAENFAKGYCTDDLVAENAAQLNNTAQIAIGYNNSTDLLWVGFIDKIGITAKGEAPADTNAVMQQVQAYLAQRYADGNPVKIRYLSSTLQSETDFTADNEYTAYKGGTEKVLYNDGKEYGAENTLTQDYILVTEV